MLKSIRQLLAENIINTEFEGKVWLAGGCVRDEILGKETKDIDITVELPNGGIKLAKYLHKQGIASQPVIYKQFGTALITINEYKVELVMTRKESYRYRSRKPDVQYGSLLEDVLRRDFTINSLLLNVTDGKIVDLSRQGLADLEDKIIRATSNPDIIFREDPLRMQRAIRFATTLDFTIEKKTWSYIRKHFRELKHISRERIADETLKILNSQNFLDGMALLLKSGLKSVIFPGLRFPRYLLSPVFFDREKNCSILLKPPVERLSLASRLVLLFWKHRCITKCLQMLKLSAKEIRHIEALFKLCKLAHRYNQISVLDKQEDYRLIAWQAADFFDEFLLLYPFTGIFWGGTNGSWYSHLADCQRLLLARNQIEKNRFSLTGHDLIRTFCIKSSPRIGKMLDAAFHYWLRHPDCNKQELLDYLKKLLEKE